MGVSTGGSDWMSAAEFQAQPDHRPLRLRAGRVARYPRRRHRYLDRHVRLTPGSIVMTTVTSSW
jgi:arylamine N-acetyltransferase